MRGSSMVLFDEVSEKLLRFGAYVFSVQSKHTVVGCAVRFEVHGTHVYSFIYEYDRLIQL